MFVCSLVHACVSSSWLCSFILMHFFACPLSPEITQNARKAVDMMMYKCKNAVASHVDMPHLLFHCHGYAVCDVSRGRHITLYGGIAY